MNPAQHGGTRARGQSYSRVLEYRWHHQWRHTWSCGICCLPCCFYLGLVAMLPPPVPRGSNLRSSPHVSIPIQHSLPLQLHLSYNCVTAWSLRGLEISSTKWLRLLLSNPSLVKSQFMDRMHADPLLDYNTNRFQSIPWQNLYSPPRPQETIWHDCSALLDIRSLWLSFWLYRHSQLRVLFKFHRTFLTFE